MGDISLKLFKRIVVGKKVKTLRENGTTPVHFYGRGIESQSLQVDTNELKSVISQAGSNIPVNVEVEGQDDTNLCFVREVQRHPVSENLLHADFNKVDVSRPLQIEVPIILIGEAPAVRTQGGTLLQPLTSILVESLPMDIPALFELDVSGLEDFEKSLRVKDILTTSNIKLLRDEDAMIARVVAPRVEEEATGVEEEGGDIIDSVDGDDQSTKETESETK
jgi:large subunit ribosomal protein L25